MIHSDKKIVKVFLTSVSPALKYPNKDITEFLGLDLALTWF